jgi:uncharacterized protein YeaO (DUF488 family)
VIRVKRVYDDPAPEDGRRVLVDRLWPRGLAKESAALDAWLRDAAPSDELRKWYGHDPDRFSEFSRRYRAELREEERSAAVAELRELARDGTLTLLTATRDAAHSQAAVLAEVLRGSHRR